MITAITVPHGGRLAVGQEWVHHSGRVYTIAGFANEESIHVAKFPLSVIYQGENGNMWVRPAWQFVQKFTRKEAD